MEAEAEASAAAREAIVNATAPPSRLAPASILRSGISDSSMRGDGDTSIGSAIWYQSCLRAPREGSDEEGKAEAEKGV